MPTGVYKHKKLSKEHKKKIGDSQRGVASPLKGRSISEEHKRKISENNACFWKGKKFSSITKNRMSVSRKNMQLIGEKSSVWKGDYASYRSIHYWVDRHLGKPKECSVCGKDKNRMSWANIDHKYRRVAKEWVRMCPKCHGEFDKINNLRKRNG